MIQYYEDLFDQNDEFVNGHPMVAKIMEGVAFFRPLFRFVRAPLEKFAGNNIGTRMGQLIRERSESNWESVYEIALEQCQQGSSLTEEGLRNDGDFGTYWMFFGEAAHAGFRSQNTESLTRLEWELGANKKPIDGYFASESMLRLSVWAHLRETGRALHYARLSVAADWTWVEPAIWEARLSVGNDPKRAARLLRDVLFVDPSQKDRLFEEPDFNAIRKLLFREV